MRLIANIFTWILIGAAGAFLAGFFLALFSPPPVVHPGVTPVYTPLGLAARASVQGAVIGFFVGLFGPRLYGPEP